MNTPTPRTDAAWSATFDGEQMSAGRTARALRECSQQLETELAAERAIVSRIWTQLGSPTYAELEGRSIYDLIDEIKTDRAEVEKWQSVAAQMSAEREHNANEAGRLRAEVERLNAIGSWSHTCIHHTDEERKAWAACPCCLAVERARLDWLESPAGMDWQWQAGITRATIDAKMQEGAK